MNDIFTAPVDPDRFTQAVNAATAGMTRRSSIRSSKPATFEIEGKQYELTDTPLRRFTFSLLNFLNGDEAEFFPISSRIHALGRIVSSLPDGMVFQQDGFEFTHPAVMHVAAQCPMGRRGGFIKRQFLALLKLELKKDEYRDIDQKPRCRARRTSRRRIN